MVHTLALRPDRTHGRFGIGKLNFTRITAEAGAIAIHGAALLLLLAPMNMPAPQVVQTDVIPIITVKAKENPQPLPKPKPVDVSKPHIVPTTPTTVQQKVEIQPIPVDPMPGDTAADPVEIAKVDPGVGDAITAPLIGAHLEYEAAPPPPYPPQAIRDGLMGTVVLRVLVGIDGKAIDVQIEHSSGHRMLDAAARKQVLSKWRFKPAMENGRAVQAIGLVPIDFNL